MKKNLWEAVVVGIIVIAVLALAVMAYNKGYRDGYKKLEVELVYTIAGDANKFVGNFYLVKDLRGNTVIGVYESVPRQKGQKGEQK